MRFNIVKRLFSHHRDLTIPPYTPPYTPPCTPPCTLQSLNFTELTRKIDSISNILCASFFLTNTIYLPLIIFFLKIS